MTYNVTVRFDKTNEFVNYNVATDDPVDAVVQVQRHLARKGLNDTTITAWQKVEGHQNFDVCI